MRKGLVWLGFLAILAAASLAVAMRAAGGSDRPTPRGGTVVRVTERDFHIAAPRQVEGGNVRISLRNSGPDHHELIMIRTRSARLPLRSDGLTVDEEALEKKTVEAVEPFPLGGTHDLRVHLAPGRYQLLCNMSGHYLAGMHRELVVR
jgi:uncharacterized cupredoxin-like copper-binding protein